MKPVNKKIATKNFKYQNRILPKKNFIFFKQYELLGINTSTPFEKNMQYNKFGKKNEDFPNGLIAKSIILNNISNRSQ